MSDLEKFLQDNSIYSPSRVIETDIPAFLKNYEILPLSSGLQSRVFHIPGENWVIKEGRWDITLEPGINIPAEFFDRLLDLASFSFVPKMEEVARQYDQYTKFVKYFGVFNKTNYFHPELERITAEQLEFRANMVKNVDQVLKKHRVKLSTEKLAQLKEILGQERLQKYNFLPKEYLLYGDPISPENKGRKTYYIFQEFITGKHLHDMTPAKFPKELTEQFILFTFLVLALETFERMVPDTRPRNYITEAFDWLSKTDNIIVADEGMKFIDTRWFWETNSSFLKRGLLLADVIVTLSARTLVRLLKRV